MHIPVRGSARERILGTAGKLFYEHGFQAIGVDLIVERSAVTKTSAPRAAGSHTSSDERRSAQMGYPRLSKW